MSVSSGQVTAALVFLFTRLSVPLVSQNISLGPEEDGEGVA